MTSIKIFGFALGVTVCCGSLSAQSLPPLLANLTTGADEGLIDDAFRDRILSTFPKDIGSSTLGKLLDLDGFEVATMPTGQKAALIEYKFPCVTSYIVTWAESDSGVAEQIKANVDHKCY